jgi:hypothetical protein
MMMGMSLCAFFNQTSLRGRAAISYVGGLYHVASNKWSSSGHNSIFLILVILTKLCSNLSLRSSLLDWIVENGGRGGLADCRALKFQLSLSILGFLHCFIDKSLASLIWAMVVNWRAILVQISIF